MTEQGNSQQLLEIYKLHAELADRISQRREGANRLYVSILTAFMVAVVFATRWGGESNILNGYFLSLFGGLIGVVVCISWYLIIRSYRQMNTGKFKILKELEGKLPFSFFCREWDELEKGKDFKKYWQLTEAERLLPASIGFVYLLLFIYGLWNIFPCVCHISI